MSNNKVSILIPVYNSAAFLFDTINSVIKQSYRNIEIIIVDDGSSDDSLEIAKSFEYTGIVKVYHQSNKGACAARNLAFEKSNGDYIQYLDSDDLLSFNKIDMQMELIKLNGDDMIYSCRFFRFFDINKIYPDYNLYNELDKDWDLPLDWLYTSWAGGCMGQTSIWLTPRKLILQAGPWDNTLKKNQDGEFFCRVLLVAKSIRFSKEAWVYYRSGLNNSISQIKNFSSTKSILLSYEMYERHTIGYSKSHKLKKALAINYKSFIYLYYDDFPDLVRIAKKLLCQIELNNNPLVGGNIFKFMTILFGFEKTLYLRSIIRLIKKKKIFNNKK